VEPSSHAHAEDSGLELHALLLAATTCEEQPGGGSARKCELRLAHGSLLCAIMANVASIVTVASTHGSGCHPTCAMPTSAALASELRLFTFD
jgi:hypothetical protein